MESNPGSCGRKPPAVSPSRPAENEISQNGHGSIRHQHPLPPQRIQIRIRSRWIGHRTDSSSSLVEPRHAPASIFVGLVLQIRQSLGLPAPRGTFRTFSTCGPGCFSVSVADRNRQSEASGPMTRRSPPGQVHDHDLAFSIVARTPVPRADKESVLQRDPISSFQSCWAYLIGDLWSPGGIVIFGARDSNINS